MRGLGAEEAFRTQAPSPATGTRGRYVTTCTSRCAAWVREGQVYVRRRSWRAMRATLRRTAAMNRRCAGESASIPK